MGTGSSQDSWEKQTAPGLWNSRVSFIGRKVAGQHGAESECLAWASGKVWKDRSGEMPETRNRGTAHQQEPAGYSLGSSRGQGENLTRVMHEGGLGTVGVPGIGGTEESGAKPGAPAVEPIFQTAAS